MVSLYQLAILCQFNAADAFSYKELQTATSLDDNTMRGALAPLVKTKLLNLVKEDGEESYELNYSAFFCLAPPGGKKSSTTPPVPD